MPDKRGYGYGTALDAGSDLAEDELCYRSGILQTLGRRDLCRWVLTICGKRPCVCCAAVESAEDRFDGLDDNGQGNGNPGGFEDTELEAFLKEFLGTLIPLLKPHHAEVVRRAELLNQPTPVIARELTLSEQVVEKRLSEGRNDLLELVLLTLQQPVAE